jgi:flagellar basal-body rod protein FlgF
LQGDLIESGKSIDFALSTDLQVADPATGDNIVFDGSGKYITPEGEVIYRPQAFFTVQDNEGNNLYTRNGSFSVSATGQVLSAGGFNVLDANGNPLVLTGPQDNLKVDGQGNLINTATGLPSGTKIGVSVITRPQELVRDGNGVFHADDIEAAEIRYANAGDNLQVRQGYLENSNVDPTQVTVDMNAAYRAYEANQKVIQFYDTSLQKTVNEVGRV